MITAVTVMKVCSFCPGVELLLSEVYDSAFSGLRSGHSFSQTNIYRVLQRRMLGVRLALTGRFRCKIISCWFDLFKLITAAVRWRHWSRLAGLAGLDCDLV